MVAGTRLLHKYIVGAVLPYLLLALVLLTAILFLQQVSRFIELVVSAYVPFALVARIITTLIPGVLVFTIPISVLAGTIIGFSRMGSDSELVAMRSGGVGTRTMLGPVVLLGIFFTGAALYINMEEAPAAARSLRRVGLQAALAKLDSPVEPKSFNTEIPGYVVYVRDGDKTRGAWGRVFLFSQDSNGSSRTVTARSGRIDFNGTSEQSELVLSDAVAALLPSAVPQAQDHSSELDRMAQLRILFNTGRKSLLTRLHQGSSDPDEMGIRDLRKFAATASGAEGRDAQTLMHKKITSSLSPLVFALLGTGLGLQVKRGGRGAGVLLSLATLLAYFLISLIGEQMARAGTLPPFVGAWLATSAMIGVALCLFIRAGGGSRLWRFDVNRDSLITDIEKGTDLSIEPPENVGGSRSRRNRVTQKTRIFGFPVLLDLSLFRSLLLSFLFGLTSLVAIALIFTLFQLWRFIAMNGAGIRLMGQYLFFLLPLIIVQLLPASVLLAVLMTYALLARRREAIAWWACGQSVYRLGLPGLVFAALIGGALWGVQENIMPGANIRQSDLRAQIRGGLPRTTVALGMQWLASAETNRLYAYEYEDEFGSLGNLTIYDFEPQGVHLQQVRRVQQVQWRGPATMELTGVESFVFTSSGIERKETKEPQLLEVESRDVFRPTIDKPAQLSARSLRDYINTMKKRGVDVSSLNVALQRKYAEPFSTLVMGLLGIPLALSFGRRSAITALCFAIGVGLAFWGLSGSFQQLGAYALLPAAVAAWSPTVIFIALGAYLFGSSRT